jgi:hypothetical protein
MPENIMTVLCTLPEKTRHEIMAIVREMEYLVCCPKTNVKILAEACFVEEHWSAGKRGRLFDRAMEELK